MYDEEWFQGRDDDTYDSPIRYNSYDTHLCIEQFMSRTEQWTWSTQKPNRPNSTRKVLGGSKNIRVGFRVLISGYFRIRVGIRSYISYFWTRFFFFFFEKNSTLCWSNTFSKTKIENEKASSLWFYLRMRGEKWTRRGKREIGTPCSGFGLLVLRETEHVRK